MPGKDAAILDLISTIYDTAADRTLWPGLLERLTNAVGGNAGDIELRHATGARVDIAASYNVERIDKYALEYAVENPVISRGAALLIEGNVVTTDMLIPDDEYVDSDFYNEILRPQRIHHMIGGTIVRESDLHALLTITRQRHQRAFGAREFSTVRSIMPHLKRALQMQQKLTQLEMRSRRSESVLDQLAFGVVVVDEDSKVLFANAAAERMIAAKDGLCATKGAIHTETHSQSEQLRAMVKQAASHDLKLGSAPGGTLRIRRRASTNDLVVLVCPMPDSFAICPSPIRGALLFISAPNDESRPAPELLHAVFGLTPAEARVAEVVATGRTVAEAAAQLQISRNTAHSHLQVVFQKTGARRQAELVKLVSNPLFQLRKTA